MKHPSLLLPLFASALLSCAGESPAHEIAWATPTGAPTLAFFDQGDNPNWLSSANPAQQVLPHFADKAYDALVFDGSQGLANVKANGRDYALARWISGGTFYVVSTKHESGKAWDESPRVQSFMKQGNVSKAFRALAEKAWGWGVYPADSSPSIQYAASVAPVQNALAGFLQSGSVEGDPFDYYVLAEPAYSALKAKYRKAGLPFHTVYDMQREFSAAFDGADIPAAAVFVQRETYVKHPEALNAWLARVDEAIETVATDFASIIPEVAKFDEGESNAKFGLSSAALRLVAKEHEGESNPFHYRPDLRGAEANLAYANAFQKAIGEPLFDISLFLE